MATTGNIVIAIDGPAGAGKSTIAKAVAKKLGFLYIDTGALYRALTVKVQRNNVKLQDTPAIISLARQTDIQLHYNHDTLIVLLNNEDVSEAIRLPVVTEAVSDIAKIKEVREVMNTLQQKLAQNNNSVLEGRDIGTVVFPNARYKFFLDASLNERTQRRFKEFKQKDIAVNTTDVYNDLSNRDHIDSTRDVAPLKKADDAIYIDTTNLSIQQVTEEVLRWIKK